MLTGVCATSTWFEEAILGSGWAQLRREATRDAVQRAWDRVDRRTADFASGVNPDAVRECERALADHRPHAVVIADLGHIAALHLFEARIGPLLVDFARGGGGVAFPSSDGHVVVPLLRRLFGVSWSTGVCYESDWAPPYSAHGMHAVHAATFAWGTPAECLTFGAFHATAWALLGVPPEERLFVSSPESGIAADEGRDTCAAVHAVGSGSIAFFGDINCEAPMIELLAAYCKSQAWRQGLTPPPRPRAARWWARCSADHVVATLTATAVLAIVISYSTTGG